MKPGWKTTEFWVTVAQKVLSTGAALMVFFVAHKQDITDAITTTAAGVSLIWGLCLGARAYVQSRTNVKVSSYRNGI